MKFNIRLLYLYLFSFVGLFIVIMGSITIVNLGIRSFVFKDADRYEIYSGPKIEGQPGIEQLSLAEEQERQDREMRRQRQRELSNAIAMLVVGAPVYLYHWRVIQKDTIDKK